MPLGSSLSEPAGDSTARAELTLRECWYAILQRRWLIAAIASAVLAITAIGSFLQTPQYRAKALIQVARGKINLLEDVASEDARAGYDSFYATQQEILRSRNLARRVIDDLELWLHPLFQGGGDVQDTGSAQFRVEHTRRILEGMLRISPVQETQLIEIEYTTPDPELSARLANSLARQYIIYSGESASGVGRSTSAFIRGKIDQLQQEIDERQAQLQAYTEKEDLVMMDERDNMTVQRLKELSQELTQAQAERVVAEAHYESLKQLDVDSFPEILQNGTVQNLKRQSAELQGRYAELSIKFKPNYPELQRTKSALEEVNRRLDQEMRDVAKKVLAAAQVRYESALNRERILRRAVESQKQEARDLSTVAADYQSLKMELDNKQQILEELLRRQSETGLSADLGELQPLMTVRLVDEAVAPTRRYKPNLRLNLSLGAALGLVLGLALAFFLKYWDTSLYSPEDLRQHVSLPLLGVIPRHIDGDALIQWQVNEQPESDRDTEDSMTPTGLDALKGLLGAKVSRRASRAGAAPRLGEQLKFLRDSLLLSSGEAPPRIILVTSSIGGEGKTFIACHLAACLTELGRNVVLVDADLRVPKLQEVFHLPDDSVGLTSLLAGQEKFTATERTRAPGEDCIHRSLVPDLSVILAGPRSPAPAELLRSSALEDLLQQLRKQFDFVVLDSAPLLPVVDSHVLVKQCEAAVLVTRSGYTPRQAVSSSKDLIERKRGKFTGVVLNDFDFSDYAQRYYYGFYGYGYGTEPRNETGGEVGLASWTRLSRVTSGAHRIASFSLSDNEARSVKERKKSQMRKRGGTSASSSGKSKAGVP